MRAVKDEHRDGLWTYVRGERTHGGRPPLATMLFASPDRWDEPPAPHLVAFSGVLVADGYAGINGP